VLLDDGLVVCAVPDDVEVELDGLELDGLELDELELGVELELEGLEFEDDVLGDCATAAVTIAIAATAVVANNKRLFMINLP
jgi:hypothetical protein